MAHAQTAFIPPHPAFSHSPLPDSTSWIRLLQVLHGGFGKHMVCEVSIWPLKDAPPYHAISYTWGDPSLTTEITVNGRAMVVRLNCEYVLQQVFTLKQHKPKHLWIDAICIDQGDLAERGHQIALMGELYQRAERVLACVGPHADDSKFIATVCRKKRYLLEKMHSMASVNRKHINSWSIESHFFFYRKFVYRSFFTMTASAKSRLSNAFVAFMNRSYFSRVWMLQELYMGTEVFYCCGEDILPAAPVSALCQMLYLWYDFRRYRSKLIDGIMYLPEKLDGSSKQDVDNAVRAFRATECQRGCLALAAYHSVPRSLSMVLSNIQSFQCADERDKLYGILALVHWTSFLPPAPDYRKDVLQVAAETLDMICKEQSEFKIKTAKHVLDWTRDIAETFNISDTHPAVQEAMRMRCGTIAASVEAERPSHSRSRIRDRRWKGIRLCSSFLKTKEAAQLNCANNATTDEPLTLLDNNGLPFAQAPPETRANDWYVKMNDKWHGFFPRDKWTSLGLILRDSTFPRLTMIGLVHEYGNGATGIPNLSLRHESFSMYWDPQDLILFHVLTCNDNLSQIPYAHRVCGSSESSYAEYKHPTDVQEKYSDRDIAARH